MTIQLNIFTNAHSCAPSTELVQRTYESFTRTFGVLKTIIWYDPHPNQATAREYLRRLQRIFPEVRQTASLSDGYLRSIEECESDYLFQLEGDWVFRQRLITDDLDEILSVMDFDDIYHFRFNKRPNVEAGWDRKMVHCENMTFKYCITNNLSNNPHIINRKRYADDLKQYIKLTPGSKGIEENLNAVGTLESCLYGGYKYPATVEHLDGRKLERVRRRLRII